VSKLLYGDGDVVRLKVNVYERLYLTLLCTKKNIFSNNICI